MSLMKNLHNIRRKNFIKGTNTTVFAWHIYFGIQWWKKKHWGDTLCISMALPWSIFCDSGMSDAHLIEPRMAHWEVFSLVSQRSVWLGLINYFILNFENNWEMLRKDIFPTAYLAQIRLYAFYFRSHNPKQWSTPTYKSSNNKQQD